MPAASIAQSEPLFARARGRIRPRPLERLLAIATAAALAVDAYVHLHDARFYDAVRTSTVSQATLFRIEAVAAIVVGVALLVRPRPAVWVLAFLVAAGGAGAVELYTHVNVGAIGPIPNMYEPTWAVPGKTASAVAEIAGAVVALAGLVVSLRRRGAGTRSAGS